MKVSVDLSEFRAKLADIKDTTIAGRAATYLLIRAEMEKLDEEFSKAMKPLRDINNLLTGYFEKFLTDTGQQTAVTPLGTVHWNTRTTAKLEDPEAFMQYVIANSQWDLLDRRANGSAVKDQAEKTGSLPPGVKLNTIRTVGVNVPGAKVKGK